MKRVLACLICLVAVMALAATSLKKEWQARYTVIGKIFARREVKTFAAMMDKDFVYVGEGGKKLNKEEFIKAECDPIAAAAWFKDTATVTSAKAVKGGVAVAYDWRYSMPGSDAKGKFVTVGREIGTDYWHKVSNKWLCYLTKIKKVTEKQVR